MADYLRVARLYLVILAIFTVGRWIQSIKDVPYEKAHHVFSIVIMTFMASAFFAAFCRRWRGYTLLRAMGLGLTLGLMAQIVIFLSTFLSYSLGMTTYFNHPTALNVTEPIPMAQAMTTRAQALVVGPIFVSIAAAIGWALGGLLPGDAARVDIPVATSTAPLH